MEYLIFGAFFLLFLGIVYFFGYTYAGLQMKKTVDFRAAFGRALRLIFLLTLVFATPMCVAFAMSVDSFPDAFAFMQIDTWHYVEMFSTALFEVFGILGIPFFIGLWRKYKKQTTFQPVAS